MQPPEKPKGAQRAPFGCESMTYRLRSVTTPRVVVEDGALAFAIPDDAVVREEEEDEERLVLLV